MENKKDIKTSRGNEYAKQVKFHFSLANKNTLLSTLTWPIIYKISHHKSNHRRILERSFSYYTMIFPDVQGAKSNH